MGLVSNRAREVRRPGPLGARGDKGATAVDRIRPTEPGSAKTGSANHLRIPDLRNDQATAPARLTAAGSPVAVRASIVRNERFGPSDHARRAATSLCGLRSWRLIRVTLIFVGSEIRSQRRSSLKWTEDMTNSLPDIFVVSIRNSNFQLQLQKNVSRAHET